MSHIYLLGTWKYLTLHTHTHIYDCVHSQRVLESVQAVTGCEDQIHSRQVLSPSQDINTIHMTWHAFLDSKLLQYKLNNISIANHTLITNINWCYCIFLFSFYVSNTTINNWCLKQKCSVSSFFFFFLCCRTYHVSIIKTCRCVAEINKTITTVTRDVLLDHLQKAVEGAKRIFPRNISVFTLIFMYTLQLIYLISLCNNGASQKNRRGHLHDCCILCWESLESTLGVQPERL